MTEAAKRTDTSKGTYDDGRIVVDFDQHSPEYQARSAELSHELRGKCPVTWSESHGGFWIVSALDEVSAMYKHPEFFSAFKDTENPESVYRGIQIPDPQPQITAGFLEMDPPVQLDFRRVLNPYLSPAAIEKWEPFVRDFTHACINDVIESGRFDFVDDLVNIVPAILTMAMLGLPLESWEVYCEPTHALVYTPPDSPDLARVQEMAFNMLMNLAGAVAAARENSRPGMIKALIDAEVDGEPLDDAGIIGTVFLVIGGGFDTTTAFTSNVWRWLAENPAELARLLADRALLDTATEEFLRYFSPSQGDARTVTQDCEVAGYRFAEGDRVLLSFAMPNRDPKYFPDPDTVKLDRFPNRHAAFGLGNHRCIGSNIARMQFKTIIWETLQRIPEYSIDTDATVRYESIGVINGNQHMPTTFEPGQRRGPGLAETMAIWQAKLDEDAAAAAED
jgi:cytochrome P450